MSEEEEAAGPAGQAPSSPCAQTRDRGGGRPHAAAVTVRVRSAARGGKRAPPSPSQPTLSRPPTAWGGGRGRGRDLRNPRPNPPSTTRRRTRRGQCHRCGVL
eukprot:scaffold1202_cov384-Prasinococcus_capsulatus_cf.AAC.23